MALAGFGMNSGSSAPPKGQTPFGTIPSSPPPPPPPHPNPSPNPDTNPSPIPSSCNKSLFPAVQSSFWQQQSPPRPERPARSPNWGNQPSQPTSLSYIVNPQRLSPVAASSTAHDAEAHISTEANNLNVAKRTRSPPLPSREEDILGLYIPSNANANARRPAMPSSWDNQPKQAGNHSYISSPQRFSPVVARRFFVIWLRVRCGDCCPPIRSGGKVCIFPVFDTDFRQVGLLPIGLDYFGCFPFPLLSRGNRVCGLRGIPPCCCHVLDVRLFLRFGCWMGEISRA